MFDKVLLLFLWLASSCFAVPLTGRIVNGTDAVPGQIPYIVSLRWSGSHICGASIIDETHILTAAHCVGDYLPVDDYSIQYGVTEITDGDEAPNVIRAATYTLHPNYTSGNGYYNDVAVIELTEPMIFSDTVQPVTFPEAFAATPEGCNATLAGWGLPYTGGKLMKHLQVVNLLVYSDEDCEAVHKDTGPTNRLYNICAGVPEGGKGQCTDDSGGPLLCDGKAIGAVSWSVKPCGIKGYPGVFAKVSTQVPWIRSCLSSEGCEQ